MSKTIPAITVIEQTGNARFDLLMGAPSDHNAAAADVQQDEMHAHLHDLQTLADETELEIWREMTELRRLLKALHPQDDDTLDAELMAFADRKDTAQRVRELARKLAAHELDGTQSSLAYSLLMDERQGLLPLQVVRNPAGDAIRVEPRPVHTEKQQPAPPVSPNALGQVAALRIEAAPDIESKPEGTTPKPLIGDWKNLVRAEAYDEWVRIIANNGTATLENVAKHLADWCVRNGVKANGGKSPRMGYIKTHVIDGKHWEAPRNLTREKAREHVKQKTS